MGAVSRVARGEGWMGQMLQTSSHMKHMNSKHMNCLCEGESSPVHGG
jgi:hypothetical protein